MRKIDALNVLDKMSSKGIFVYTLSDLSKAFPKESLKTLMKSVERLVRSGILDRVVKGIYVYSFAKSKKNLTETIAATLRRGSLNYISLESALSEYGVISQVPIGVMTIMTTGAAGRFETNYGTVIEFTKTRRKYLTLLKETEQYRDAPIRIASPSRALGDLKRVGRNINMVDELAFNEIDA